MIPQDLAHAYARMNGAMWFGAAERLLGGTDRPDSYFAMPGYFLACHAFEVLLKAALLRVGFSEEHLRRKFGHSLAKLLDQTEQSGFQLDSEVAHDLKKLSPSHERHTLRYSLLEPEQTYPALPWMNLQSIYQDLVMLTHPSRLPPNIPTNFSNR